ncbi:MAG: thiamine pyrophosphate-binding protein [Abditibacteriales bacterium]|nr:thiamine pyrophosphate-binding protein [Abditibacteriales bacterium]MDW8365576.1 thiamine pyrophosphate-binding protein [Abditibacteriales bacterium]
MAQARLILEELKKCHVTHVLSVPDNMSRALLSALWADGEIEVILVTREGEAFAVAAGLWVGGKTPVVLIQNTGFLETGDAVRGTGTRMRVPLLCLITYRGYAKWAASGLEATPETLNAELLSNMAYDSTAILVEPTLRAWGIPYDFLHDDTDVPKISAAFRKAQELEQPVALLMTKDTT